VSFVVVTQKGEDGTEYRKLVPYVPPDLPPLTHILVEKGSRSPVLATPSGFKTLHRAADHIHATRFTIEQAKEFGRRHALQDTHEIKPA
jgi:hypothetical protein